MSIAAGAFVGIGTLFATGIVYSHTGVLRLHPERVLYIYDLAALSTATDEPLFPPNILDPPLGVTPPDVSLPALERRYDYVNVITLYPNGDPTVNAFRDEKVAAHESALLRSAWLSALREAPLEYVENRAWLFLSQTGLHRKPSDAYIGLSDPRNFGYGLDFRDGYHWYTDYLTTFVGVDPLIPLDLVWVYIAAGTVLAVLIERRTRYYALPVIGLIATLWLNLGLLAVVGLASGFRYMVMVAPVALICAFQYLGLRVCRTERFGGLVTSAARRRWAPDSDTAVVPAA